MNPDLLEQQMHQDPSITAHQRRCMQEFISRLKEITKKIEELDDQEDRIQGDSPGARDRLRAINISRIVYVNQQKDLEEKLSDIVNSCPSEPVEDTTEICLDDDLDIIPVAPSFDQPEELEVLQPDVEIPSVEPSRQQPAQPQPVQEIGVKKPRFKFEVLSYNMCPSCDARVPANYRTCGRCGTKLQNFCPHCSAVVPGGLAFCGKCGKPIA